ncbi:hypothetical protein SEA_PHEDRO_22 [Microbacterium phage Phedro]|uniref:Uncharacterized protein n=5 Tax=Akonivirus TaxID=2842540 RepID=A0A6M3TBW5_9CAUD|nr:hypothetical protein HWD33_gp22 [Microbacterium phage Phedro]QJD52874.1 hypothetical protein SEA_PHRACTURED_22 [Microbacterium phage Phractured]QJD52929.1 hypothetical protein SEA_PHEDRO_22 [Microbacterium phage Phedro]QJD52984.1 hypothetical protein SEA_PHARKY_22 [Microbacterium phage Pharky]QWY82714.1 hypothetical protein SEA_STAGEPHRIGHT_22 [Microbacterium phage StagePhright]
MAEALSVGKLVNNMPIAFRLIQEAPREQRDRLAYLAALSINNQRDKIRKLEEELDKTILVSAWLTKRE